MSISCLLSGFGQHQNFLAPPRPPLCPPNPSPLPCFSSRSFSFNSISSKPQQNPSLSSSSSNPNFPNSPFLPNYDTDDNNTNNNNGGGNNRRGGGWRRRWSGDDPFEFRPDGWWIYLPFFVFVLLLESPALARALSNGVLEVRGGHWTRLVPDETADSFVIAGDGEEFVNGLESCWRRCRGVFLNLMLPEGYPNSVSSDYLEYSLWRALQGIASQINGVLATQVLP